MMFQVSTGVLGALAVILPFGAMHLPPGHHPLGRDLATRADVTAAAVINRTAKSDRGSVRSTPVEGRTVSIRIDSLPDASIVIRIPGDNSLVVGERGTSPRVRRAPASQARRAIACEPVVSVLTDIARQLEPGRCVT
ncbi:hypothetical protein [Nitrobacter sp.]|uniref:hypothetical protein n=1 Tax=Nitrobacter sp. TaxID=29420 RepID=UPI0029CAC68F|nr:hypothetical protein [Nitrobacter sp.]